MNPILEAILKAYDEAAQARGDEASRFRDLYESQLTAILERTPNLSRHALELAVELAYSRWKQAQSKFPSILPRA